MELVSPLVVTIRTTRQVTMNGLGVEAGSWSTQPQEGHTSKTLNVGITPFGGQADCLTNSSVFAHVGHI